MSETRNGTSRYLALERRIRRSTGRSVPGSVFPGSLHPGFPSPADGGPDEWTGTADRLRAPEETGSAVARATSTARVARAFDDGAPIELHHDRAPRPPAGSQAGRAADATRPGTPLETMVDQRRPGRGDI